MPMINKTLIFPRGGKVSYIPFNADLTLNMAGIITNTGVVNSINFSMNINTSDLPDGSSDFPMGVYDTGREGSVEINYSSYNPVVDALLSGADYAESKAATQMWSIDEEIAVPAVSPFTAPLQFSPAANGTIVIVDAVSSPFVKVSATPAAGQFSVSASTVTFSSADAGRPLLVTYDHIENDVTEIATKVIGARPVFQTLIQGLATVKDEVTQYDFNLIIDKVKAQGNVGGPVLQRSPQGFSNTLRILKPRPGYAPVYKRLKEITKTN
jgi:hypothetical protein